VRVRPGRGSRPRTRRRPDIRNAASGFVTTVDRGRYRCAVAGDADPPAEVVAVRARELGRRGVVVGDEVSLVGDLSGGPDALARVVRVTPRRSALRRTADDDDPVERVVVANVDQLAVVAAIAQPAANPRLVDRCLVAAADAGIAPLLVLTKGDLGSAGPLRAIYRPAGVPAVVTGRGDGGRGLAELMSRLTGHRSALVGPSGVGKSTLVNALLPSADRRTGAVNAVTGRGRHTSASAVALALPDGGWLVDTPGLRSFGLAHVPAERLLDGFPELSPGPAGCPGDCDHLDPGVCGLDRWVAAGHAHPLRLASFRRLLRSRAGA
jgi:ribosome biogenesis GTPase